MRKMFIVMMFTALLVCGCETKSNNNIKSTTTTTEEVTKEVNNISNEESITSTTRKINNTTNTTKTNTTKKSTTIKKTSTSDKITTTKKNPTTDKTDSNGGPYYYNGNLPECSNNDTGLVNYIKQLESNGTYKYFLTYKESREYGEYAAKTLGYGYWYQQEDNPRAVYKGSSCYRELWAVQLYVPSLTCGKNDEYHYKSFNLPPTPKEELIDSITYVIKNKGWNCSDRKWIPIK